MICNYLLRSSNGNLTVHCERAIDPSRADVNSHDDTLGSAQSSRRKLNRLIPVVAHRTQGIRAAYLSNHPPVFHDRKAPE